MPPARANLVKKKSDVHPGGEQHVYGALREGFLKKKNKYGRWQKRWFRASDHYLLYASTPAGITSQPACINLQQVAVINYKAGDKTFDLDMASDSGNQLMYSLKAERSADAREWFQDLQRRRAIVHQQHPQHPQQHQQHPQQHQQHPQQVTGQYTPHNTIPPNAGNIYLTPAEEKRQRTDMKKNAAMIEAIMKGENTPGGSARGPENQQNDPTLANTPSNIRSDPHLQPPPRPRFTEEKDADSPDARTAMMEDDAKDNNSPGLDYSQTPDTAAAAATATAASLNSPLNSPINSLAQSPKSKGSPTKSPSATDEDTAKDITGASSSEGERVLCLIPLDLGELIELREPNVVLGRDHPSNPVKQVGGMHSLTTLK